MRRNTVYFVILLLAVAIAAVLSLRLFFGQKQEAIPAESPQIRPPVAEAAETAPPETLPPPESPAEAAPPPTETPVFETRPPAETPAPAPAPTPVPAIASGSFRSDTGTYLNLLAGWMAYTEGGGTKLRVDLSAESYSFYTDAIWNALELTVNGETYTASSPAVRYDGQALIVTPLHSFTLNAAAGAAEITAVWHYNGSYSGKELEDITASGTIYIP